MKFSYNPPIKVTKQYILNKYSQEEIFAYYLHYIPDKKLHKSQIRIDNNPTVGFFKSNDDTIVYHDFATGQGFDCIGYVQELYHINYHQAIQQIANDFHIKESNVHNVRYIKYIPKFENKGPANIRVKIKDFTESELKWWKSFGISHRTLKKYHVYSCENVFLNDNLFTTNSKLTFGYYGGKVNNIELWRIYYSQRKEYRFLTNWPSKKIQGYDQLSKYGNLLVITKSMKDVMSMYEFGITACAPNSETQNISDPVLQQLKERFRIIVYMYDNDYAGIVNMNKIKKQHPELNYFFIPRFGYAKDFTDLVKKVGIKQMKNYILQVIRYYSNKWKQNKEFKYGENIKS